MIVSLAKQINLKRLLLFLLGIVVYYYVIQRISAFHHWGHLKENIFKAIHHPGWIFLFFGLWASNVFFELKKWQELIQPFQKVSLKDAFFQFLAGSYTAAASPGRLAEPGGRMLLVKKENRMYALAMTTLGGVIQNVVIIVAGLIVILGPGLPSSLGFLYSRSLLFIVAVTLVFVAIGLLLVAYRNKIKHTLLQIKNTNRWVIVKVFLYTTLRYAAYNLQFYVIMRLFNIPIQPGDYLSLSPLYFLFVTIIPSFIFTDLGIRGSIGLLVYKNAGIQEPTILSVILVVWLFNVLAPAIAGGWVVNKKSHS